MDNKVELTLKLTHSFHIQWLGLSTALSLSISIILSLHDTQGKLMCIQHTEDFIFLIVLGFAVFH